MGKILISWNKKRSNPRNVEEYPLKTPKSRASMKRLKHPPDIFKEAISCLLPKYHMTFIAVIFITMFVNVLYVKFF